MLNCGMSDGRVDGAPFGLLSGNLPEIDHPRIERAVREILLAIGEDPDREGLAETPARVARSYAEIFAGLRQDPAEHLARVFPEQTDELVIVRDIDFSSMCEHHLLPFMGRVHVAYEPNGQQVVGLSKLARTVDVFSRRPQVQERLTGQIADAIQEHLGARGVLVMIESEHLCMRIRGAKKSEASMVTTAARGVFKTSMTRRSEVLGLFSKR
jgi:GTP cyclohydrolase I